MDWETARSASLAVNRHVLKQALICKVLCKVIGLFPEEWLKLQNKALSLLCISFSFAVTVIKSPA